MLIIGSYFFAEIKSEKEILICYIIYVTMLKLN